MPFHLDPRALLGLVLATGGLAVVAMSYAAAYMLGRLHGRREADRHAADSLTEKGDAYARARLDAVEASLDTMAGSIKRLGDAQRIWVNYQDRAAVRDRSGSSRTPA